MRTGASFPNPLTFACAAQNGAAPSGAYAANARGAYQPPKRPSDWMNMSGCATMPGMDTKTIQPSIDALNAEIQRLTSARDTLQALLGEKEMPISNRAEAQRKRWAEEKRRQRAARKAKK